MFQNSETFFDLISRIRQKLLEAGTNTIATLPRVYKTMQSYDGNQKVGYSCFFAGIEMYGIIITKEEKTLLVKTFDRENDGKINFDEFLFAIRGKPNDDRQKIIDLVYYKFDKQRTGFADPAELRKVFNCVRHPRYLTGELTEDQIFFLYLQNFVNKSKISKKEWDDYYSGVSTTIDNDNHFIKLIKNQFKVE